MMEAAVITTVLLGAVGLLVVLVLYGGLVLWVLWGWFIVPLGAPQISLAWAIGRHSHFMTALLKPAVTLGIGWVAKQFM